MTAGIAAWGRRAKGRARALVRAFGAGVTAASVAPFWERKTLAQMSGKEWEALCDGCGRCCVLKLEDAETGEVLPTSVACRLLNLRSCRCRRYRDRHALVPECLSLDVESLPRYSWLPTTCAYRRLHEGRGLAWWHPLVSGRRATVAEAGVSVRDKVVSEAAVHPDEPLEEHIVRWVDAAGEDALAP